MIDRIISNYLSKNKRLVIPEFGAFIRKDGGELVFVEFLKKDDQVLTSLMEREYQLDETEVKEAIEDYIRTAKRTVGQAGKYIIEGVGALRHDVNGLYSLDYDPLIRREAAPAPQEKEHAVAEKGYAAPDGGFAEPEMEVVNARAGIPSVEDDVVIEQHEDVVIFPAQNHRPEPAVKVPAGVKAPVEEKAATATEEFELRYREVDTRIPPKKNTLNDLYSVSASEPADTGAKNASHSGHAGHAGHGGHSGLGGVRSPDTGRQPESHIPARHPVNYGRAPKKKFDLIMILAIIAAVIALGSLVFGILVKRNPSGEIRPTNPQIESVETEAPPTE